jgi:hypothetical protein
MTDRSFRIKPSTPLTPSELRQAAEALEAVVSSLHRLEQRGVPSEADSKARIEQLLDSIFTQAEKHVWLHTPQAKFGGRSPLQAIESGDAALIALALENALAGHPD